ncbi:MAG: hypothetical protein K6B46_04980 [Opitutales bacterium]|nr:hypothetical protein [Opitutales bacterium]
MVEKSKSEPDIFEEPKALMLSCPGDLLTTIWISVLLKPLKKKLAGTRIYLLVKEANASIFNSHERLDGLLTINEETKVEDLTLYLKRLQIDTVVHIVYNQLLSAAALSAGIKNTIAFKGKTTDVVASCLVPETDDFSNEHPVFHAFRLLEPLGVTVPVEQEIRLDLSISDSERVDLLEKLKRYDINFDSHYAVICLDAGRSGHFIDARIFAKAAKYLHGIKMDLPVILVSFEGKNPKASRRMIDFVGHASGINLVNFSLLADQKNKLSPAQVSELLKHAHICISADNAVAYLADFVSCPLVTLLVDFPEYRHYPRSVKSELVYTSAQKIPFIEPRGIFHWRASQSFSLLKIRDAIDYVLSF